MRSEIIVDKIITSNRKLAIHFHCNGEIANYLKGDLFTAEYDCSIENVPESILIIPFLSNICPIAWITDTSIYCRQIDEQFLGSLNVIRDSFQMLYPKLFWKGNLYSENIVNNHEHYNKSGLRSAMFFSGGIDSMAAYIQIKRENPILFTVWGADIDVDNHEGWQPVITEISNFANSKDTTVSVIKSNFRAIINYISISAAFKQMIGGHWWPNVQHGLGIIGLSAPVTYQEPINKLYFAATLNPSFNIPLGSRPEIDNNITWGGNSFQVFHQGYELTRHEKVALISDYIKKYDPNLKIRVCWLSKEGGNCSICEKCTRTIISMILEGLTPANHGFRHVDANVLKEILYKLENNGYITPEYMFYYNDIKKRIRTKKENLPKFSKEFFNWLESVDFNRVYEKYIRRTKWYYYKGMAKNIINKFI